MLTENPNNEFHINAKYDNSSAVSAEVFHVVNRQRITDALVAMRLNNSHLLHNRIHWRPSMINDLKVGICIGSKMTWSFKCVIFHKVSTFQSMIID